MTQLMQLWQNITTQLKNDVGTVTYNNFISPATPIALDNDKIIIQVSNKEAKDYWNHRLAPTVAQITREMVGHVITPIFKLANEINDDPVDNNPQKQQKVIQHIQQSPHLNDKYTFDRFIVGKGNTFAYATALAVTEDLGNTYNPLLIYGGVGLGKTHLMQAIGHRLLAKNPNAKVKYVTSEKFTNDFISSIRYSTQEQFREEYRSVDALLIDDIQFFATTERTQEEVYNTFNDLLNRKKQIVMTSDRLPKEIPRLKSRLVSRFEWGVSTDITPPDLETRIAILKSNADTKHLSISDSTLSYISGQIDSNVRELEGALNRVEAYARARKQTKITVNLAAEALRGLQTTTKSADIAISDIQKAVADYFQVSVDDLKGKKRIKQIVTPRQVAMYLSRELTINSLPKIGNEFGGRDHTTVMHAYEKIQEAINTNDDLKDKIIELKKILNKQAKDRKS